jgi:hypothetical protein
MLCRCGLFFSGCFAAVVVLAPLADALPPRLSLVAFVVPLADASPPRLNLVASAVSPLYWLPSCCVHVSGLVGGGFEVEGLTPLVFFLLLCSCGITWVIQGLLACPMYRHCKIWLSHFYLMRHVPMHDFEKKLISFNFNIAVYILLINHV